VSVCSHQSRSHGSRQYQARRHWTFQGRNRKVARLRRWLHGGRPVLAAEKFSWMGEVEANWQQVRREPNAVMV
jgi:hypothetical protein